jgi:CSLREA domain-containing protein
MTQWPFAALVVLLGALQGVAEAQSFITVDTPTDVVMRNGLCSLREAIIASNMNTNADILSESCSGSGVGDVIGFRGVGTINVASALPIITEQVTIGGPTARVVIHGPGANDGIVIASSAPGTVVSRLVINGFASAMLVQGADAVITGNFIGTNATGTTAASNQYGIKILANNVRIGGTTGVTPGGSCTGDCNLIAASTDMGIRVESGSNILIQGNMIGTNAAGTAALGNTYGIALLINSTATIGGTMSAAGNLISGNSFGIFLSITADAAGSSILGNRIGTNAAGTAALPNGTGVHARLNGRSYPLLVGGASPGAGNVISGNTGAGVVLMVARGTVVQGNWIGTLADSATALGNGGAGVDILSDESSPSQQNLIGGDAGGSVIAFNGIGVRVSGTSHDNAIVRNSIHDNAGKGIQLDNGQGGLAETPSITSLNPVTGTGCFGCRIDVYSDAADEGRTWHGTAFADAATGDWSFPGEVDGPYVTATATKSLTTSEFSAPFFENSDGDMLADIDDNCTLVTNQDQYDANQDGYGNICDADLNDSGLVASGDYIMLRNALNTSNAIADLNHSGLVTGQDYIILRNRLNTPPGPSGLRPNCPPTCP